MSGSTMIFHDLLNSFSKITSFKWS
uniref:Uncharacterized protein n=1 Tax=Arundo donax TaxID=35708 RepID=A0A0A9AY34_ARUDO